MSQVQDQSDNKVFLSDIAGTVYFTGENAAFYNKDGYITVKSTGNDGEKRVLLHRLFPYDVKDGYISVLDTEQNEMGIILSLDEFEGESRLALESELNRKYYIQKITGVVNIKDRHGFTYWTVDTVDGKAEFTLHDTYRSIYRISEDSLIITDVDGNRYGIDSIKGLDGKSYKRIELYL